jgi:23S rRNA (uracil1939-C5)-methyltransferase
MDPRRPTRSAARMSETFELRIDSIAAGGDGVGRRDGMVVFVPRSAPGDLACVVAERQDRLMRGRLASLLEASERRVDPCCDHYVRDRCGGCQLQHLSYDAQLDAKGAIIRDALIRIGRRETGTPSVTPSDKQWRYRRKLTLKLRRVNGDLIAGLHRYDAPDEIFKLKDCPITDERVLSAWSSVLQHADLLPRSKELRAAVRLLATGFSLAVEGADRWESHAALFTTVDSMRELWWKPESKRRRLLHSRTDTGQAGASFIQVNPEVADALREYVVALANHDAPESVVDAYAGTGDLAAAFASRGARVVAIEIDRDAARVASTRLAAPSKVVAAPVEQALAHALPADLVIVNPPRAGLDARVPQILNSKSPRRIIYVSCNPATLARDVRRLESYRVGSLRGFDMFPQTAHVETVCELVRET